MKIKKKLYFLPLYLRIFDKSTPRQHLQTFDVVCNHRLRVFKCFVQFVKYRRIQGTVEHGKSGNVFVVETRRKEQRNWSLRNQLEHCNRRLFLVQYVNYSKQTLLIVHFTKELCINFGHSRYWLIQQDFNINLCTKHKKWG